MTGATVEVTPVQVPVHLRHLSTKVDITQGAEKQIGGKKIRFVNPNVGNYDRNIKHAAKLGLPVYQKNMLRREDGTGQPIVLAGAGPSLTTDETIAAVRDWVENRGALLVAVKKAIKVLHDAGFKIDWAASMDPGDHIACPERIFKAPGTKHLIASSSDPALFEYLKDEEVWIFHSATGYEHEVALYNRHFKNGTVMGGGYNVLNRALAAFLYMGCRPVCLVGADGGWREGETFYADGTWNRPGVDMCDNGMIDGRPWMTRPDMLASAVALARVAKTFSEEDFVIVGDVLPAKLRGRDEDFLRQCAQFE